MDLGIENARAHLGLLIDKLDTLLADHWKMNEAKTRISFIDPLLTSVLGWNEIANIFPEERYTENDELRCVDYLISLNGPVLVVEAKRLLKQFEIPDTKSTTYKLSSIKQSWPAAWAAISQCRQYCDDKGARYGLVTNGRQFIAFKGITEQGHWSNGEALVWRNPDDLKGPRFTQFYECLSRETILQDKLSIETVGARPRMIRQRPRTSLSNIGAGFRNDLHDVLHQSFQQLLLDTPDPSPEFLEQCYVTSETVFKYGKQLNSILVDEKPLFRNPISPVKAGHKKDPFHTTLKSLATSKKSSPLVVIMGGAGVGKTTFMQWYFRSFLPKGIKDNETKSLHEKTVVIHCDYRTIECQPEEVRSRTLKELVAQMAEKTKPWTSTFENTKEMYRERIKEVTEGDLKPIAGNDVLFGSKLTDLIKEWKSDQLDFLKITINYLLARCGDKQTVIILDNMDQKDEKLQTKLYQVAQELVFSTKALVILALREATYLTLSRSPQFNAFSPIDFHVKVQPAGIVIDKRFDYLTTLLSDDRSIIHSVSDIPLTVGDLRAFIRTMSNSLVGDKADMRIVECIEALSNANTREQLRTVYAFLVSGQTKITEYVLKHQESIPFHEFLDSIIHEDRKIFVERKGHRFMNIFDLPSVSVASHFTLLRVLLFLKSLGQQGDLSPTDYISVGDIFEQFEAQGWPRDSFEKEIRRMAEFGLLMPQSQDSTDFRIDETFALTRCGLYYLEKLYWNVSYLSAMAPDTAMTDQAVASICAGHLKAHTQFPKIGIRPRLASCKEFLNYLENAEASEMKHSAMAKHPLFGGHRFVPDMRQEYDAVAQRVYGRDD